MEGRLPPPADVENWFWEGIAAQTDFKTLYCSDLEGTAFPESGPYGEHPWSLQRLADHERSLLRFVEYAIPGVNAPMLYFGMLFSMFCWHVEDCYMYSVSYLHEGANKTWYGVSPRDADAFDEVFSSAFPQAMEKDPQLLLRKAAMLPPSILESQGVRVCRARQEAGQFVVTLPQAYHAGFSHGANTAEAVNFMLLDWLPYAAAANARYRGMKREPVLDLEQILMRAAADNHSPEVVGHLAMYVEEELDLRAALREQGCAERLLDRKDMGVALGRGPPCMTCGHVCHMSFVMHGATARSARPRPRGHAYCPESHLVCLRHAADLPLEWEGAGEVTMHLRYND